MVAFMIHRVSPCYFTDYDFVVHAEVKSVLRSTPPSRPNNVVSNVHPPVRPYVRPSVRPQKVPTISVKFGT